MSELGGAALLAGLGIAATIREPPGQLVERRLKAVHSGGRPGANRSGPGWSWLLYSWRVRLAIAAVAVLWMGATPRLLVPAVLVGGVAVGALTVRTRLAARKQIVLRQTRLGGALRSLCRRAQCRAAATSSAGTRGRRVAGPAAGGSICSTWRRRSGCVADGGGATRCSPPANGGRRLASGRAVGSGPGCRAGADVWCAAGRRR